MIALHDLVNNKIRYGEDGTEYAALAKEEEKKEDSANDKVAKGKKQGQ